MTSTAWTAPELPAGLTWEEFLALPDELRHAELIDGEVVVNPPTSLHQLVVARLWSVLDRWIDGDRSRGEVTMDPPVGISERRGYLPDLAWFPPERCAGPGEPPAFTGPPGIAVEVLSPSTRTFDVVRKRADYARIGVAEVWLVDPSEPAAILCRHRGAAAPGADYDRAVELTATNAITSPLLDGFSVTVAELLRR